MSTKESSDELNPATNVTESALVLPQPPRTPTDYLALAIATCGVGYLPLAPGTWGSLVGVGVFFLIRLVSVSSFSRIAVERNLSLFQYYYIVVLVELVTVVAISLVGIWAASRTEKLSGKKDPSKVVIDEVAGQLIALMAVPLSRADQIWSPILAFVLFRFFDIVKPYPARRLESLDAGLGIMADDIVAGVYAAVVVAIAVAISWSINGGDYRGF